MQALYSSGMPSNQSNDDPKMALNNQKQFPQMPPGMVYPPMMYPNPWMMYPGMYPGFPMMPPGAQMPNPGMNFSGQGQGAPAFNFSGQYFYKPGENKQNEAEDNKQGQSKQQVKQSHLAALKTKTPTQIVNEFKAYTLPKLRLKRLVKLQAVMRGYHARKYLIPRRKVAFRLMDNYVDRLIKNYIEDKIVPDIVLEILAYNKYNEDVHLYSTEYRAYLEVMDRIVMRVIRDQAEAVVKESTDNLVTGILRQRDTKKPPEEKDPLVLLARDVIVNSIKQDCREIAKSCIEEMTFEYMEDIHIRNLIREKFLTKAVKEVVVDAIQEIAIEELFDDMVTRNTRQLALPLAQHMFDLVQQEMEGAQLDKALDNYLLRGMIDIMLEQANVIIDDNNKALMDIQQTLQQSSAQMGGNPQNIKIKNNNNNQQGNFSSSNIPN